jgi:hypothetical protein
LPTLPGGEALLPVLFFVAASYHTQVATLSRKLMLHLLAGQANARLFGLDLGDWSVLLGGSVLAALVLFLN